jgi:hypothetical protein
VSVDVHVEAPGNIHLDAGQVTAELAASLDFRGTMESLGLGGTMTPLWAEVRYRDLVFEYTGGDISFTEEFRVMARYDLVARAEGCGMTMSLNLTGDSRGVQEISLTGEDERGPVHEQDPWSCVTYGMRLSEHAGSTQVSAQLGAERATIEDTIGSGLDLLWGVSGLDAKVKSIVPYVDEARITLGRSGPRGARRLSPRLVIGKEVGRRLKLKYDGALDETNDHKLSLEYQLSGMATLDASWVTILDEPIPVGNLGLDLRLRFEFE